MKPLSIKQAKILLAKPRISDKTAMGLIRLFKMDIEYLEADHREIGTWVARIIVRGGWLAEKENRLNNAIQNVAIEKIKATARREL